jgi:hypothetical protein
MKTFLECLDEAAAITEAHHISAYIKLNLDEIHLIMLQAAADIYASQSNSHTAGIMQARRSAFREAYQKWLQIDNEAAFGDWLYKRGQGATVADGADGKNG